MRGRVFPEDCNERSETMQKLLFLFCAVCCCGLPITSQGAPTESDQPKLTLSIDSDEAVSGSYTEKGRTISIEALRGEENIGDDPDILPYVLDIRILDEDKIPFLVQNSGVSQDLGDTEWTSVRENPNDAARQHAIGMLPNAIRYVRAALAGETQENATILNLTGDNQWEITAILNLMRSMTEDLPGKTLGKKPAAEIITMATSYQYKYEVKIRRKQIVGGYTPEHSALLVNFYNGSGKYLGQFQSCNHGTCAGNSAMSTRCSKTFSSNNAIGLVDKVCDTFTSYRVHVCHDDTRIQYLAYKNGYYGGYSECYAPMLTTPNCD